MRIDRNTLITLTLVRQQIDHLQTRLNIHMGKPVEFVDGSTKIVYEALDDIILEIKKEIENAK